MPVCFNFHASTCISSVGTSASTSILLCASLTPSPPYFLPSPSLRLSLPYNIHVFKINQTRTRPGPGKDPGQEQARTREGPGQDKVGAREGPGQDQARTRPGPGQDQARTWPGPGQGRARTRPGPGQDQASDVQQSAYQTRS